MAGGASMEITSNADAIARAFERAGERSEDTQPLMETIGALVLSQTQERFLEEAGPDGEKWPVSLRVKFGGGNTLRDSQRLFQSLTYQADADSAEIGTNLIYAAVHQFGAVIRAKNAKALRFHIPGVDGLMSRKSVRIPDRPFLGLNAENRDAIAEAAQDWLAGLIDEAAGGVQ
jgi:phage virion morphogenesis protein